MKKENIESECPGPLYVMKFGGTSVGGARPIERVANLIERYSREGLRLVVVASAIRGVTDSLVKICDNISSGNSAERDLSLEDIFYKHLEVINDLNLPGFLADSLDNKVEQLFHELQEETTNSLAMFGARKDKILSFGERFSVRMIEAKLLSRGILAEAVDGFNLIETDDHFGEAIPNIEKTTRFSKELLNPMLDEKRVPIVTGFIGATSSGRITTLGRGGSDYTDSILGRVLNAREVW